MAGGSVLLRARRAGDVPGNDPVYTEGKVDTPPPLLGVPRLSGCVSGGESRSLAFKILASGG